MEINWPKSINIAGVPTLLWNNQRVMTTTIDQKVARAHRYALSRTITLPENSAHGLLDFFLSKVVSENIEDAVNALRYEVSCLCACDERAVTIHKELLSGPPAEMLISGVATCYAYED